MTTKKEQDKDVTVWVKADGKTTIELNNSNPGNKEAAEKLGWKVKK